MQAFTKFTEDFSEFIENMRALTNATNSIMVYVQLTNDGVEKKLNEFIRSKANITSETDDVINYEVPFEWADEFSKIKLNQSSVKRSITAIPRSMHVSLITEYEAYLSKLIRQIYLERPELLASSDKKIDYASLLRFDSVDDIKSMVLDEEIDGVLMKNSEEQLAWFERKLGYEVHRDAVLWPQFHEAIQRRHLFVHTDGVISRQYIEAAKKYKFSLDAEFRLGARIFVSREYIDNVYRLLTYHAFQLYQYSLRNIAKNSTEADGMAVQLSHDQFKHENYALSINLLEFCKRFKYSSEEMRRKSVVNYALAHKKLNQRDKALEIIGKEDWSASDKKFKLAVALIADDFTKAAEIMPTISKSDIGEGEYRLWTVFEEFRKTEKFREIFTQIFGKPFTGEASVGKTEKAS